MREFSHKNFTQEVSVVPRDNRVISRKKRNLPVRSDVEQYTLCR